jgi:tryptophan-rich sensory protein
MKLKLFLWIAVYLIVSFGLGQITQAYIESWYSGLEKPFFNPPNWIFAPVWGTLYVMIASAGFYLWHKQAAQNLKIIFIGYTILNWGWTPIFFGLQQLLPALLWIAAMNIMAFYFIVRAWKVVPVSAHLMILPLCWTIFAMILNGAIWMLNS